MGDNGSLTLAQQLKTNLVGYLKIQPVISESDYIQFNVIYFFYLDPPHKSVRLPQVITDRRVALQDFL
jgi:hypothetical protein